jgi:hypothetical protein
MEPASSSASVLSSLSGSEERASEEDILNREGERGFDGSVSLATGKDLAGDVERVGIGNFGALGAVQECLSTTGAAGAVRSL